jgi:hypothetical protein
MRLQPWQVGEFMASMISAAPACMGGPGKPRARLRDEPRVPSRGEVMLGALASQADAW